MSQFQILLPVSPLMIDYIFEPMELGLRCTKSVLLLPISNRTCWTWNLLDFDRKNVQILWNHVRWLKSIINHTFNMTSCFNPFFPIIWLSIIVRKKSPYEELPWVSSSMFSSQEILNLMLGMKLRVVVITVGATGRFSLWTSHLR